MWTTKLGGRKFIVSMAGLGCTVGVALAGGSSEAFIAIGTIVLAFNGGNAAVEWRHAGTTKQFDVDDALAGLPRGGAKTDDE